MQLIINLVIKNKTFLFFLLLFALSITLTIQSRSYHNSKFINSANAITGKIYSAKNNISQYFDLRQENNTLLEENKRLKTLLHNISVTSPESLLNDKFDNKYEFITASVYKNSYTFQNNYITINKGLVDGVKQDYGVVTSKGVVGIIENVSTNYASVISILNSKSRINAQLKKTNHFGSLIWDGKSPEFVQLIDISKFAPLTVGDTIVTGRLSTIFPPGIPIGNVSDINYNKTGDTYTVQIKLFNDMSNLGHVYIIENKDVEEVKALENLN